MIFINFKVKLWGENKIEKEKIIFNFSISASGNNSFSWLWKGKSYFNRGAKYRK